MNISSDVIQQLRAILPVDCVLTDPADCIAYSYDNSRFRGKPDMVILPHSTEQVAACMKICYKHAIPVYARGKGSATTGASVPTQGGIVFSLEQMHNIIELNAADRFMVVQPGITNEKVQLAAKDKDFFWPPDPSSASTCSIGGNLACNTAGPRAVKYGTCRENTLGLTAVTGSGEIIKVGCHTTKGVVGFDFTRLIIGSEGTLAIITEAILKLQPLPESKLSLQLFFSDMQSCAVAVAAIMAQPSVPCALEFIDEKCLDILRKNNHAVIPVSAKAMLMVEIDGLKSELPHAAERIKTAATNFGLIQIDLAKDEIESAKLWALRKSLSPALRTIAPKKINEDIVVPVSKIPEFIQFTDELSKQYQLAIINFGHAGNGNLHTNIMLDPSDAEQDKNSHICLEKIFAKVLELRGTLSGEHGIGLDKRDFIAAELDSATIALMHGVKKVFDPKGILNPGKAIPKLLTMPL